MASNNSKDHRFTRDLKGCLKCKIWEKRMYERIFLTNPILIGKEKIGQFHILKKKFTFIERFIYDQYVSMVTINWMQLKDEEDDLPAFDIGMTSKDSTGVVRLPKLILLKLLDEFHF